MREILLIFAMLFVALIVTTGLIWLAGSYFGISIKDSYFSAAILLSFMFGGIWNIVIMFRGEKNLSMRERICAGVRGVGMSLCGVTVFLILVIEAFSFVDSWYLLLLGIVLWFGSMAYEDNI